MSEPGEQIQPPEDPRIPTIKSFIGEFIAENGRRHGIGTNFDVSDPRVKDMAAIRSGEFEIRRLKVTDGIDTKGNRFLIYSLFAGDPGSSQTEIHMSGDVASELEERIKLAEENASKK